MASWVHGYWWSNDGLQLHFRDYPGPAERPPIVCIAGLTRNARDFEPVADRLAGAWRVICVDLRGRGESAYAKDPMTYVPLVYLQDLEALIRTLGLDRFILFGTSLGGIMAMLLATAEPGRVAGALLNDIGPDIDPKGIERIRGVVGRSQSWQTWLHAARHFAETQRDIHPDFRTEDWLAHAKRVCRLNSKGRVVLDYDMRIAEPFKIPGNEAGFDMWSAYAGLRNVPTLLVRGERSDLLSVDTLRRMTEAGSATEAVTVPRVGHAPTLSEPAAVEGMDRLLARILANGAKT